MFNDKILALYSRGMSTRDFPQTSQRLKVIYLEIQVASKKWIMPIHHWKNALNRFMIEFPDRMPEQF